MKAMTILRTLWRRLVTRTPKLYAAVRDLMLVLALLTGLPELLDSLGIDLPQAWEPFKNKFIGICATLLAFLAQLTVEEQSEGPKPE